MTAGRSAGTEQGQGREVVHACPEGASGFTACCNRTPFELDPMSRMTVDPALVTCSPSVPPARDSGNGGALGQVTASRNAQSGRDEAREAVARWLAEWDANGDDSGWTDAPRDDLDHSVRKLYLGNADELLSLPAVAALLRDGTTT